MRASDVVRLVRRITDKLHARVDTMISTAVVKIVNDALKTQGVQVEVLADEVLDDVEHMQPGGLSHNPPSGAEGVLLSGGGRRANAVLVNASARAFRPKNLLPGETLLYAAGLLGGSVKLGIDGSVIVTAGGPTGGTVTLTPAGGIAIAPGAAGLLELAGGDNFVALANLVNSRLDVMRTEFLAHTHSGVTTGGGTSGVPNTPMTNPASVAAAKTKAT